MSACQESLRDSEATSVCRDLDFSEPGVVSGEKDPAEGHWVLFTTVQTSPAGRPSLGQVGHVRKCVFVISADMGTAGKAWSLPCRLFSLSHAGRLSKPPEDKHCSFAPSSLSASFLNFFFFFFLCQIQIFRTDMLNYTSASTSNFLLVRTGGDIKITRQESKIQKSWIKGGGSLELPTQEHFVRNKCMQMRSCG